MSFKDYYQSELSAIRQHASRLVQRQPALGEFFGQGVRDPDVERLIEGVSFLTGRLRQKIDDELPEITHGLTQRLWANYLRPMPSMCIVQFDPLAKPGPAQQVPQHCEIKSHPIEGVQCRFRTVFRTEVLPLTLDRLMYAETGNGALLTLGLSMTVNGYLGELEMQSLRLHLAGNPMISQSLYLALMRHLLSVRLRLLDNEARSLQDESGKPIELNIDPKQIKPVGFGEDEALIPPTAATYRGYRLLQEFFVFKEKFLFVDVTGLEQIKKQPKELLKKASGFELRFEFSKVPAHAARPTIDNIKLYCTPATNLFRHHAFPVALEAGQRDYPLLPDAKAPEHCEVFSVEQVRGSQPSGNGHREYLPLDSCTPGLNNPGAASGPFYSLNLQPSALNNSLLTTIRFKVEDAPNETVAIDLNCTNRNLPTRMNAGDLCVAGTGIPGLLKFKNITPATASYAPPVAGKYLWRLISNMSLNYLSLADVEALKEILRSYDLPAFHDRQAQQASQMFFDALQGVSHQHIDYLKLGRPVRGIRTQLDITPQDPQQEAEWFLLGSVLDHFFALYASAHSFNQLHIKSNSGQTWTWEIRPGQQINL